MGVPARVRIALLECDHTDPDLRHLDGDYGDMHAALLAAHGPQIELERVDVVGGQPLPAPGAVDGYLITGSRYDAVDDRPWIRDLAALVRSAHAAAVPTVGICFGHQLIAHALGGRVERAEVGWGVGVHPATLTPIGTHRLGNPERFHLLLSHQDQVLALPPGAQLLATSDHAPVAAFAVGSMLGFQGHPEFSPGYLAALLDSRTDRIPGAVLDAAHRSLDTPTQHAEVAGWMVAHLTGGRR